MQWPDSVEWRLAVALAIGLLMGAEREKRKGQGAGRRASTFLPQNRYKWERLATRCNGHLFDIPGFSSGRGAFQKPWAACSSHAGGTATRVA